METKALGWTEESRSPVRKARICPGSCLPASGNRRARGGNAAHHRAPAHRAGPVLSLFERAERDLSCSTPFGYDIAQQFQSACSFPGREGGTTALYCWSSPGQRDVRTGSVTGTGTGLSWGTWWVRHVPKCVEKSRRGGFICGAGCFLIGQQGKGEETVQVKGIVI